MKILKKDLKNGLVVVSPENLDDLWHLDKVIEEGDLVSASTTRKFVADSGKSERKRVNVSIRVESLELDASSERLHLLGTIESGRPEKYVSLGAHHSIDVGFGLSIGIIKQWKKHHLQRLDEAVKASKRPKLVIVALDDEEAEVALVLDSGVRSLASIRSGKSGKQFEGGSKQGDYFSEVLGALKRASAGKVVVAGPGFVKDDFKEFCDEKEPGLSKKILVEGAGSGGSSGVKEVIKRGIVERVASDARLSRETLLVERVLKEIACEGAVSYGLKPVEKAIQCGAVEILLVSEDFFQKNRVKAEKLMVMAGNVRAKSHIINSEEEPGKKLDALGGVAALLRFSI